LILGQGRIDGSRGLKSRGKGHPWYHQYLAGFHDFAAEYESALLESGERRFAFTMHLEAMISEYG